MKAAPARPLTEEGTAFERQLLDSARADAIPAASLQRLARALSVPNSPPVGPRVTPSRLAGQGSLMKLAAWGGLGVTAATAALFWLAAEPLGPEHSGSEHSGSERAIRTVLEPDVRGAAMLEAPALEAPAQGRPAHEASGASRPASPRVPATHMGSQPAFSVERAAGLPGVAASDRPHRARAGQRRSVSSSSPRESRASAAANGGLRAELSAVEGIQRALRAGRNGDAERQLADHARRFPRGELALEADLLRVDLDVARGDLERARSRARALLARADATRYRARLEALTRHAD